MAVCPACIQGSLDEGTPRGEEQQLAGVPCYVSRPAPDAAQGPSRAVILGSDVFGHKLINLRLIADVCAANGYLAVVPDYLRGTPVDMQVLERASSIQEERNPLRKLLGFLWLGWTFTFGMRPWMAAHPGEYAVQVVTDLAAELKQEHGIKHVVYTGYCYGGSVGILLAGKPGIAEGIAVAHPGPVKDSDLAAIQTPMLFCLAASDQIYPPALVAKTKKMLESKRQESGLFSKVVQHAGTQHGYATRAPKSNPVAQAARKDALQQVLSFFSQVLGSDAAAPGDGAKADAEAAAQEPVA